MPIQPSQKIALGLAGTVAFPSPPPATGSIDILPQPPGNHTENAFLRITHNVNARLTIRRIVSIKYVRLIHAPKSAFLSASGQPTNPSDCGWVYEVSETIECMVDSLLEACPNQDVIAWICEGVVYVPEDAPVLLQVEAGMTAHECADYYPPMTCGDQCSDIDEPHKRHHPIGSMWCNPWP